MLIISSVVDQIKCAITKLDEENFDHLSGMGVRLAYKISNSTHEIREMSTKLQTSLKITEVNSKMMIEKREISKQMKALK